jgi:hypothetical protein
MKGTKKIVVENLEIYSERNFTSGPVIVATPFEKKKKDPLQFFSM